MIKLSTLCEKYLSEQWWLSDSTKETTKRAFKYLIKVTGDLLIDRVTYRHGEQYKGKLLERGSSKNTVNMYIRAMKPAFGWAVKIKMLSENPLDHCKQIKVTQKPIRLYEDWEFWRLLRFAPNDRWRAILIAARTTGLRRGELLNLTKDNIRDGFIFVEPKRNTERTWEWEPKDQEIRKVPIIEPLEEILSRLSCYYPLLTDRRYENLLRLKKVGLLTGRVRKCPDENFRRQFVNIQRKAFGKQIGDFHSWRKTFITNMLNELPDYFVLRLSGHSNPKTMVTYYTAASGWQYEQVRKVALSAIKTRHCPEATSRSTEGKRGRYWARTNDLLRVEQAL